MTTNFVGATKSTNLRFNSPTMSRFSRQRTLAKLMITAVIASVGLAAFGGDACADVTIDFEATGFVAGASVQAHRPDGTTTPTPVNGTNPDEQAFSVRDTSVEKIVDLGLDPHGKVWQIDTTGTNLQNRPHSPHAGNLPSTAIKQFSGEPGAIDDFGSETPTTSTFYAQLDFRAVDIVNGFTGTGTVDFYSNCGDDGRHSYVRVIDDGSAFDLRFFDTNASGFSGFTAHDVDLNLAYGDWHTVGMGVQFVDGQNGDGTGNDIVSYFVNGNLVATTTSWETGYRISTTSERGIDRLSFASSLTAGSGLYFDNIIISDVIIPEPGSLALAGMAVAGFGCYLRRRRRRK
jgi:hypothetical protein